MYNLKFKIIIKLKCYIIYAQLFTVVVLRPCPNACRSNVSLQLFEVKVDKKIHFNKSIGDLSLTIPLDLLGLIIGKRRNAIKTIKDETNCDSIIIDSNT